MIVRKIAEMGGGVVVHDPYVKHWWEFEKQETYPAPGHSWSRFFRNQENLSDLRVNDTIEETLRYADAVVFAVPHKDYLDLEPDGVFK